MAILFCPSALSLIVFMVVLNSFPNHLELLDSDSEMEGEVIWGGAGGNRKNNLLSSFRFSHIVCFSKGVDVTVAVLCFIRAFVANNLQPRQPSISTHHADHTYRWALHPLSRVCPVVSVCFFVCFNGSKYSSLTVENWGESHRLLSLWNRLDYLQYGGGSLVLEVVENETWFPKRRGKQGRGATISSSLVRTVVCIPLRHRGSSSLCYVKQTTHGVPKRKAEQLHCHTMDSRESFGERFSRLMQSVNHRLTAYFIAFCSLSEWGSRIMLCCILGGFSGGLTENDG